MNSFATIICYYGNFPNYFSFYLNSCAWNKDVDFFIFTDINVSQYSIPENVYIVKKTFSEIQSLVQSKFPEIEICLDRPYKLCDYKVAYGYIFSDWVKDYKYWGFNDIDLIWGKITSFFPEKNIQGEEYVKYFECGHLSFIRNIPEYTMMFKKANDYDYLPDWQLVFTTTPNYMFDEFYGLDVIFNNQVPSRYFTERLWDNIFPPWRNGHFHSISWPEKSHFLILSFEEGQAYRIYLCGLKVIKEEIAYFHFSKRDIRLDTQNKNRFLLVPNRLIDWKEITLPLLLWYGRPKYIRIFIFRTIRKLKKIMQSTTHNVFNHGKINKRAIK